MKFVEHKLATGAMLTGYLRDETTEMPSYNTRPAVLILPGGGYRYCSPREADPDRKSTRLNSSHMPKSRMPSSA